MAASLTRSRAILTVLALPAAAVWAACSGGPVAIPGSPGPVATQGGGAAAAGLTGTWRRTLVFFDESGFLHSSETTWSFRSTGDAVRTIVATNHTLGAADTSVALARWRLDGTRVTIDFTAPSPGTIVLEVRIEGATLYLAGQAYQRAP